MKHGGTQERPVVINGPDGLVLEGLWQRGRGLEPVVIAAPHPLMGGSMDSAVVAEMAWAAVGAGHEVLRFNYRGVGASQGTSVGDRTELADLQAAIEFVAKDEGGVWLAGYSFGSWMASLAVREESRVRGLICVAPPLQMQDFGDLSQIRVPVLVVCGEADPLATPADASASFSAAPLCEVEVVPEADHVFTAGLSDVSARIRQWLARFAPAQ